MRVRPGLVLVLFLGASLAAFGVSRREAFLAWRKAYVVALRSTRDGKLAIGLKAARAAVSRSYQRGKVSGAHIRSLRLLAKVAEKAGDAPSRQAALQRLVGIARHQRPPSPGAVAAALELGRAFGDLGKHDQRLALLEEVEGWLVGVSERPGRYHLAVLLGRGEARDAQGDAEGASGIWLEAAALAAGLGEDAGRLRTRALAEGARRAFGAGRGDEGMVWLLQARELLARAGGWSGERGEVLLELVDRLLRQDRAAEAGGVVEELIQAHGPRDPAWEYLFVAQRMRGEILAAAGDFPGAAEAFQASLRLLEGRSDSDPFLWLEIRQGLIGALVQAQRWSQVVAEVATALVLVEQLPPENLGELRVDLLGQRARAERELGDPKAARVTLSGMLASLRDPEQRTAPEGLEVAGRLVTVLGELGDHEAAVQLAEEQVALQRKFRDEQDESVGQALELLSQALRSAGRGREAFEALSRAQGILGKKDAPEETLLAVLRHKADILERAGQSHDAAVAYQELASKLNPDDPASVLQRAELLDRSGALFLACEEAAAASEAFREAYRIRNEVQGAASPETLDAGEALVDALVAAGRLEEAGAFLPGVLQASPGSDGERSGRRVRLLLLRARVEQGRGQGEAAATSLEQALGIAGEIGGEASPLRVRVLQARARVRLLQGDRTGARQDLEQVVGLLERGGGALAEVEREVCLEFGRLLLASGDVPEGLERLRRAQDLLAQSPGVSRVAVDRGALEVGRALLAAKRPREAEPFLRQAAEGMRKSLPGSAELRQGLEGLAEALEGAGRRGEAMRFRQELRGLEEAGS